LGFKLLSEVFNFGHDKPVVFDYRGGNCYCNELIRLLEGARALFIVAVVGNYKA
jgi:hypothetical protein